MSKLASYVAVMVLHLAGGIAGADWLEVKRGANLKQEPAGDATTVVHVDPGERLELLAGDQTNGYCKARTGGGQTGWIYRTLVRRHQSPPSSPAGAASTAASGKLEVHVINVGQADAILIRCPDGDHELLIDAADSRYPKSGANFKSYLRRHQADDNTIEVIVASHPHADHIGNMAWVLKTYQVDLYVDNSIVYESATYQRVERAFEENGAAYWGVGDELVPNIDFCPRPDVDAQVLRPRGFGEEEDPNDNSVIVRVDHGAASLLFVGDAEAREESLLLADSDTRPLLDCDFLKVGHHGSRTSSTDAFLDAVTPQVAAISCGAKGVSTNADYKHPRFERVQALLTRVGPREGANTRLEAFDSQEEKWKELTLDKALYVTPVEGDVVFESDGHTVRRRP